MVLFLSKIMLLPYRKYTEIIKSNVEEMERSRHKKNKGKKHLISLDIHR